MSRVNRLLCDKSLPSQFATLFFFAMNSQGSGQFIGAGHNPAYLFRASTGQVDELASDNLILGAFEFSTYHTSPLQLSAGDTLLVYSDGLTEAENPEGEMFGEERLLEIIRREAPAGGEVLEKILLKSLAEFTRGRGQTDDITFVLVQKHV